jgi:hypothetical protein
MGNAISSLGIPGESQQAAKPTTNQSAGAQADMFPDAPIEGPDGRVVSLVKARKSRGRRNGIDNTQEFLQRQVDLVDLIEEILRMDPQAPSTEEWSDDEIAELRYFLLASSVDQLADTRVARNTKIEIIDWMMTEGEGPFSFETCVLAEGCDPDEVRLSALRTARRVTGLDCTALIGAIENR